jgi:hypothetical protein
MGGALLLGAATIPSMLSAFRATTEKLSPKFHVALGTYFLACVVLLVATGVVLVRRRAPNAVTYLAAWVLLLVGGTVQILASIGVLHLIDGMMPMKVGSLAENANGFETVRARIL